MRRVCKTSILIILFYWILGMPVSGEIFGRYDLDNEFSEGKEIFYEVLRTNSSSLPLNAQDLRVFKKPESRLKGLYDHLMCYYYYIGLLRSGSEEILHTQIPSLSLNMALEFRGSLNETHKTEDDSRLSALLSSTGFHARKTAPYFRSFLRSMARQLKTQWALEVTKVKAAHQIAKGEKIRLAIVDSGVDPTIKEIKSQLGLWRNLLDGSDLTKLNGRIPYDWDGHGTSIASVVVQIAPEVELMIVKAFDIETMSDVPFTRWNVYLVVAGIYWAMQNGADVISLSLALKSDFGVLREIAKMCWDKNVILVTSLGNDYESLKRPYDYYPAVYEKTIAVGGVEKTDGDLRVWRHSGKGDYIDVVAPASGIWVELPSYLPKRQRPRKAAGNSLAVPIVAASSALILSSMDEETHQHLKKYPGRLVETVRHILRQSSSNVTLGLKTPNLSSGYGLIDIRRAVEFAGDLRVPDFP